jgi:hypothetical protein
MIFNAVPNVDFARPWKFAAKVGFTVLSVNLIGAAIYWRGTRLRAHTQLCDF